MWFWMSGLVSTEVVYLRCCLVVAWLVPCETAAVLAHAPCTSLQCHFIWSHRHRSRVRIAVTCHLPFWPNDQDLWHTTAVTRGWNRYQNKSQHRKLTPQKKILLPLLWGLEPETFWSWVQHPTTELSLLPCTSLHFFFFSSSSFFLPMGISGCTFQRKANPTLWQPCTSPTTFWSQVQHRTTEVSSVPCTSLHFLGFFPHGNFRLHFPEESHPCDSHVHPPQPFDHKSSTIPLRYPQSPVPPYTSWDFFPIGISGCTFQRKAILVTAVLFSHPIQPVSALGCCRMSIRFNLCLP